MTQSSISSEDTSKFNFNINCYNSIAYYKPHNLPNFYKEQTGGFTSGLFKKHTNQHEMGYIKVRFFDSLSIFKPAVTIMTYDLEDTPVGTFDWLACENYILEETKNF